MSREAMTLALEALENTTTFMRLSDPQYIREYNATVALRAALNAPDPEPVAQMDERQDIGGHRFNEARVAAQREWVGLPDMEVYDLADEHLYGGKNYGILSFYKAIEAKLKEKNT